MNDKGLSNKVKRATKWSTITEFLAKLVTPITNMVLARLLTPNDFGIVAAVTMVISFADMLTDSGFQKYLIQREFSSSKEKYRYTNVAFWTNLLISIIIFILIFIYRDNIATIIGNPELGTEISIASIILIITAFSSIQIALYKRDFNFKGLFYARAFSIMVPLFVTIPLALLGFSYWSLIIGTISGNLSSAVILTIKSKWKPSFFYSLKILKKMTSFSLWSLLESISIWLTSWVGVFIVGSMLSTYYLGLYNTSINTVMGIISLITASTTPVLFSALSRYQNENDKFNETFFGFQKYVSLLILPLGIGIFLYRDLITLILLGNQWAEASFFIGLWGLIYSISIVFGHYSSEVYRAKGKPKLSLVAQLLHLVFLAPVCYYSVQFGYNTFVWARSLIRIQFIFVHFILMYKMFKITPLGMVKNVFPAIVCSVLMGVFAYSLHLVNNVNIFWEIVSVILCIVFYFSILQLFPSVRNDSKKIINKFTSLLKKKK